MSWPFLLGRVANRTGVAVWRHRVSLILAGVVVMAFSAYELTFAGPAGTNGDCADAAMAALTQVSDANARAAYACLGPGMRQSTEDQFVATMQQRAVTSGHADRVGDRSTSDGSKIVFYTVSAGDMPSVGYIVYLDPSGKVAKVE
jgi:hypothetical protein